MTHFLPCYLRVTIKERKRKVILYYIDRFSKGMHFMTLFFREQKRWYTVAQPKWSSKSSRTLLILFGELWRDKVRAKEKPIG